MSEEFPHTAPVSMLRAGQEPARQRNVPLPARTVPSEPAAAGAWSGRATLASLGLVGLLTAAGFWIEPIINNTNLAVLYMLAPSGTC